MQISINHLRKYLPNLTQDIKKLRDLLDDIGIEVKHFQQTATDTIFVLELLANRGDHASFVGIAREIAGRTGEKVNLPDFTPLKTGVKNIPIKCETDLCLQYSATLLEVDQKEKTLTKEELYPLSIFNIHSINPYVDATNLSNLILGQPTHVFDADKIKGPITIRLSKENEKADLLFQTETTILPKNILVIADDEKILAIAGVIGCESSKATIDSKLLIIESATFDPVTVRKCSTKLKVKTNSSVRFEKGSDPEMILKATEYIINLLERHNIAHQTGITGIFKKEIKYPVISISPEKTVEYFQTKEFTKQNIIERLQGYGFKLVEEKDSLLTFQAPSNRIWDVHNTEDLYEELARSAGYNELPSKLPITEVGASFSHRENIKNRVDNLLIGFGFYEILTDGFYGRETFRKLEVSEEDPRWKHVEVMNAQDREYSLLKRSCIPQALQAIAHNLHFQNKNMKAYEWTRVFIPNEKKEKVENELCDEQEQLWLITNGEENAEAWNKTQRPLNVWYIKGLIEELKNELKLQIVIDAQRKEINSLDFLHPYRQASLYLENKPVGCFGELHPQICTNFGIKRAKPCYLEINTDVLNKALDFKIPEEVKLPTQMPSERTIAFVLPDKVTSQEIIEIINKTAPDWLEEICVTDLYEFEEDKKTVRSVTFSLTFANEPKTHSTEEVNQLLTDLIKAVEKELGQKGVKVRG